MAELKDSFQGRLALITGGSSGLGLALANLLAQGVDVRSFPQVLQYNKQDLPSDLILTQTDLDDALNFRGYRSFGADALRGAGVFETLKGISELVLKRLAATGSGAA